MAGFRGALDVGSRSSVLLVVEGEIDAAVEHELDGLLAAALAQPQPRIIVDMTDAQYLCSRGAGVLIRAWAVAAEQGKTLHIAGANDLIRRLAAILGIEGMLEPRTRPRRRAMDDT